MARIRTIKPGFFKHGDLFDAEVEFKLPLRIAYAGLWTIADREGRFKWKPRDIKPDVLPYDDVSMVDVMAALESKGFVQRYTADGQEYGYIPAFLQHQHVNKNEPQSNIPAPSKNIRARAKTVRAPSSHHEEGKGKEGKENIVRLDPFEAFYKNYPKKEARGAAVKAFEKACEKTTPEILATAASAYAAKRAGQDTAFTKLPATWLNQECWLDEGIAPSEPVDAATTESCSRSWEGRAAPLVAEIGPAAFTAYFATASFKSGPPVHIGGLKPHIRDLIAKKFPAQLHRAFGDYDLETAA